MEWRLSEVQAWSAPQAGWLVVSGGRAWLTRRGDMQDHVLASGGVLVVQAGDALTLGPWDREGAPRLVFVAAQQAAGRRLTLAPLRWLLLPLSALARALGLGLLALARSAEAMASRTHGCISAGDSMASAGVLK